MDSLKDYITKFQDPMEADAILRVQKELDETKIIVVCPCTATPYLQQTMG